MTPEQTDLNSRVVLDRRHQEMALLAAWQDAQAGLVSALARRDRLSERREHAIAALFVYDPRRAEMGETSRPNRPASDESGQPGQLRLLRPSPQGHREDRSAVGGADRRRPGPRRRGSRHPVRHDHGAARRDNSTHGRGANRPHPPPGSSSVQTRPRIAVISSRLRRAETDHVIRSRQVRCHLSSNPV